MKHLIGILFSLSLFPCSSAWASAADGVTLQEIQILLSVYGVDTSCAQAALDKLADPANPDNGGISEIGRLLYPYPVLNAAMECANKESSPPASCVAQLENAIGKRLKKALNSLPGLCSIPFSWSYTLANYGSSGGSICKGHRGQFEGGVCIYRVSQCENLGFLENLKFQCQNTNACQDQIMDECKPASPNDVRKSNGIFPDSVFSEGRKGSQ